MIKIRKIQNKNEAPLAEGDEVLFHPPWLSVPVKTSFYIVNRIFKCRETNQWLVDLQNIDGQVSTNWVASFFNKKTQ